MRISGFRRLATTAERIRTDRVENEDNKADVAWFVLYFVRIRTLEAGGVHRAPRVGLGRPFKMSTSVR